MAFQRTLDQDFIDALNRLHDQPSSWWRKLVDSPDVFLAIRNNYINAYSCGMSIGKIVREGKCIRLLVHEEYLTLTCREPYVDLLSSQAGRTRPIVLDEEGYLAHLPRIKKRAARFAGGERRGTNKIACRVLTVIDMEAAFEDKLDHDLDPEIEDDVGTGQGRMDLIVLTPDLRLRAIEAKLYANGELRARGRPKVCGQLEEYHRFLSTQQGSLGMAYRNIISILGKLRGSCFEKRVGHPSFQAQSNLSAISIDPVPRLLIFGFDELQKRGVKENAALIQSHVNIPGFASGNVIAVGGTSSIKEAHFV